MPLKIKSPEWVKFKHVVLDMLLSLTQEYDKITMSESSDNFEIYVDECEIKPVFVKKPEYLKVEYDFSFCDIKIRLLSLYLYPNTLRIDFSLKDENLEIENQWQESQS